MNVNVNVNHRPFWECECECEPQTIYCLKYQCIESSNLTIPTFLTFFKNKNLKNRKAKMEHFILDKAIGTGYASQDLYRTHIWEMGEVIFFNNILIPMWVFCKKFVNHTFVHIAFSFHITVDHQSQMRVKIVRLIFRNKY